MFARSVVLERLVIAAALILTAWGIGSFGIWDPWELVVAEAARALHTATPSSAGASPLTTSIIATAYDLFGLREWSGRLPMLLAAYLSCGLAFLLLWKPYGRRAGVIAIAVMASTPMFLLNARLLLGDAVEVLAQTAVGLAALSASSAPSGERRTPALYLALLFAVALSASASGVLLGPLPPLLAVSACLLLSEDSGEGNRVGRWLLPTLAFLLALGVLRAVAIDGPQFSHWLGGGAIGGNPPNFDKALELVFHGFAPWSAVLPVALIWALTPRAGRDEHAQRVAWVLLLWLAFSFVAWTVFSSRYGRAPYLAVVPLAAVVALWMSEWSREAVTRWPTAIVVALLSGLLIRDFALYPDSPLRALAVDGLRVPEIYNPRAQWALVLAIAGILLCLALLSHEQLARPRPRRVLEWIRERWNAGRAPRSWLVLATLLLGACLSFGLMCFVFDLRLPSLLLRVGRVLFFIPFALAALVFGLPWLSYAYGRLGSYRVFPALGGGLAVGAFVALSFQPALSAHFSPKPVYEAYAELTGDRPEPLAAYKLRSTAAHYYTNAVVEELSSSDALIEFLGEQGQRWAVIRAEQLPELNRAYRRKTGEHLYVADARSARLLLIAGTPIDGRPNQSFIAEVVLGDSPRPQHAVGANFDERIELLGYDLLLPQGDSVGAGQRFAVTWYWRVLGSAPSGYKVFVHIDAHGQRLNGDHVPVQGRYPTKLWEKGDIIVDRQELLVPANYLSGDYVMYVGLFSGSKRLPLKSGDTDGENRLNAGTLTVR